MEAMVNWQGGLSFDGKADTGITIRLDAATSGGGENSGLRPMELLAIGLAGCTAMDVISILQKKRQDVTGFQVLAHMERRDTHPKVFNHAVLEYQVTGHGIDQAAVVRSIELSATTYCSAEAMFAQIMPVELHYSIFEDLGEGRQELTTSGSYTLPEKAAA
jgi:putative redox protein